MSGMVLPNGIGALADLLIGSSRSNDEITNKQPHRDRLAQRERDLESSSGRKIFLKQRFPKAGRHGHCRRNDRKVARARSAKPRRPGLFRHAEAIKREEPDVKYALHNTRIGRDAVEQAGGRHSRCARWRKTP